MKLLEASSIKSNLYLKHHLLLRASLQNRFYWCDRILQGLNFYCVSQGNARIRHVPRRQNHSRRINQFHLNHHMCIDTIDCKGHSSIRIFKTISEIYIYIPLSQAVLLALSWLHQGLLLHRKLCFFSDY